MEYEIYYLCNLLGIIIVFLIILFHFVEADKKPLIIEETQNTDEVLKDIEKKKVN